MQQCFIFARSRPGDNLYAHPCDFIPVLDSNTGEILTIDFPHSHSTTDKHSPSGSDAYSKAEPRERFGPPKANHNYLPEQIVQDEPNFKLREGLKPLHIVQPEGVSYSLAGRMMSWQNWNFHIGFNYREGLVISNVTYDDGAKGKRPMFYRMSIAEMVVPYASTIYPHHRKHAFDTGEYGVGALANSLALGCDCLGSITYMDAEFVTRNGGIQTIKNAICIHEEDAGLLHKHTDFRDNVAHSARNRKLIVSMICTVANYEYGFYFNFGLDGSIDLEVKATGIVNAYPLGPNEKANPKIEVEVAPKIAAQHHQHLFSYRIDPMIDGLRNRVVQVDAVQDEGAVGSDSNFYGNGFHTEKKVYQKSLDACSDYEARSSRVWSMQNPNKLHYATGNPIGYKIKSMHMPPMLAKPGSMVWNRAPWARHNMFVTTFRDDELFPSDTHINQNPGAEKFGLQNWVDRNDNIDNADVVCWPMFGVTHISRPEDWPIMPVEILSCKVVPDGFFDRNPGLDVPSKKDMKSRNANEAFRGNAPYTNGVNGAANGANGTANGTSCCSAA